MKLILVFMDSCHDWFCTGAKWPYHTNIWNPSCSIFAPSLSIPHTLLCSACSNLWFFSQNMTNVNYNTVKHWSHLKGYTHSSLVTVGLADWAVMEKYEKQYLLTSRTWSNALWRSVDCWPWNVTLNMWPFSTLNYVTIGIRTTPNIGFITFKMQIILLYLF